MADVAGLKLLQKETLALVIRDNLSHTCVLGTLSNLSAEMIMLTETNKNYNDDYLPKTTFTIS